MPTINFTCNRVPIKFWPAKFKRVFKRYSRSTHFLPTYNYVLREIYQKGKEYSKAISVLKVILNYGNIYYKKKNEDMIRNAFVVAKICRIHINVTDRKYLHLIPQEALTLELCFDIINLKTESQPKYENLDVCDDKFYDECELNYIVGVHNISLYFVCLKIEEFIKLFLRSNGNKKFLELVHEVELPKYLNSDMNIINIKQHYDMINSFSTYNLKSFEISQILHSIMKTNNNGTINQYFQHVSLLAIINLNYLDSESKSIEVIIDTWDFPFTFEMVKGFYYNIFSTIKNCYGFKGSYLNFTKYINNVLQDFDLFIAMVISNIDGYKLVKFFDLYCSNESNYTVVVKYLVPNNDEINKKNEAIVILKQLYKCHKFDLYKIKLDNIDDSEKKYLICDSNTGSLTKPAVNKASSQV